MKSSLFPILGLAVLGCLGLSAAPAATGVAGNWKGTLDAGTVKLRLVFKITPAAAGQFTAKMDSLDQGIRDVPLDNVTVNKGSVRLTATMLQATYDGKLDPGGNKITGQWMQLSNAIPLNLERVVGDLSTAPEPEAVPAADVPASKAAATKLAGLWTGSLHYGTASLRLLVTVTNAPAGTATGTMDSVDQGAREIPLTGITLKEDKVRFEARGLAGAYEGTLAKEGSSMKGEWRQGGQTIPLELKKAPKR